MYRLLNPFEGYIVESRPYQPENHATLAQWWIHHGWPVMPEDHLPPTGVVIWNDSTPLAAGFIYKTNSKFALFEWVVSNPQSTKSERSEALDLLFKSINTLAKELEISTLFSTTSHKGLIERYKQNGFTVGDPNSTNLIGSVR